MPTVQRSRSIPTTGDSNLFSGSPFEYPQQPFRVTLGLVTTATGLYATIYSGARLVAEEFLIDFVAGAVYPTIPDRIAFNFVALPGERLVISIRNTTAGALTVGMIADLQPLPTR